MRGTHRKIRAKKEALTIDFILELHRIILHGIDDENAGRFRRQNVRILGVVHLPPDARKVPREMEELIAWYYSNYRKMPVPQLAADLHHRFVWIRFHRRQRPNGPAADEPRADETGLSSRSHSESRPQALLPDSPACRCRKAE